MSFEQIINCINNWDFDLLKDKFDTILDAAPSMLGYGTRKIINDCVSLMDDNKIYLEYGSHRGGSLISAAYKNPQKTIIGVDCFDDTYDPPKPKKTAKEQLYHNIQYYSNIKFFETHFRSFCEKDFIKEKSVQIYLHDGGCEYESQYYGILNAEKFFDDNCIILVDDVFNFKNPNVHLAITKICNENKQYSKLRLFPPSKKTLIYNGLAVLQFKRTI